MKKTAIGIITSQNKTHYIIKMKNLGISEVFLFVHRH